MARSAICFATDAAYPDLVPPTEDSGLAILELSVRSRQVMTRSVK